MKTTHRLNACWCVIIACAWLHCHGYAQSQNLDIGQFKKEHVITDSFNHDTGDVSIYVSFPNWFGQSGYCPFRVRVVPRKGLLFKESGQLKVLIGQNYYSSFNPSGVVVEIPIEKGTAEATGEVIGNFLIEATATRKYQFGISTFLNGKRLNGQQAYLYNSRAVTEGCRSLILISQESSKDDAHRREALAEMAISGNWFSQEAFNSTNSSSYCDVRNMPGNWLSLSSLEKISISFEDFEHIDANGLESLNSYVLSGGILVVNKVQSPQDVATFFPIDLARKSGETVDVQGKFTVPHGFGTVSLERRGRSDYVKLLEERNVPNRPTSNISTPEITPFGFVNRTVRYSSGVGDDFWNWLIPSVGRTPAIAFLMFVVLFVGGAVPGIMVWSNRHKRRVWLVVLIPITAAICTLFLFSYGLLKDGLGAVSRIRSLAFVDQNGDGMVWSRQTYFAATVSNDGIFLDEETQFIPILTNSFASLPTNEHLESDGRQQYRGFLPPRLQTQFSITQPLRKLPVLKRGPEQDSVISSQVVRNASDFVWDKAMFVGENDAYYLALGVAPGAKAEFTVMSREDALSELLKSYKSQPLVPPADSPSVDQTSLGQTFSKFFGYNFRSGSSIFSPITEEGIWQRHLGIATSDKTVLLPGTYVIFANQAPYVERCLPEVRDQEGLHTIVGRW